MKSWPAKDPGDVADYQVNWASRLAVGETIATSTFTVVTGDVVIAGIPAPSINGALCNVWLSGGTADTFSEIKNVVTTSGGRTWDQTTKIRIRSQ